MTSKKLGKELETYRTLYYACHEALRMANRKTVKWMDRYYTVSNQLETVSVELAGTLNQLENLDHQFQERGERLQTLVEDYQERGARLDELQAMVQDEQQSAAQQPVMVLEQPDPERLEDELQQVDEQINILTDQLNDAREQRTRLTRIQQGWSTV